MQKIEGTMLTCKVDKDCESDVDINNERYGECPYRSHRFKITTNGFKMVAEMSDPNVTKEHWKKMMASIKKGEDFILCFEDCNGCCEISFREESKSCFFSVSKFGGDGYGDMCVELPADLCTETFKKLTLE